MVGLLAQLVEFNADIMMVSCSLLSCEGFFLLYSLFPWERRGGGGEEGGGRGEGGKKEGKGEKLPECWIKPVEAHFCKCSHSTYQWKNRHTNIFSVLSLRKKKLGSEWV